MSILFMDGFDMYPTGKAGFNSMFQGLWNYKTITAENLFSPSATQLRTGRQSLYVQYSSNTANAGVAYVLPSNQTSIYFYGAVWFDGYPTSSTAWGPRPIGLFDAKSNYFIIVHETVSGELAVRDTASNLDICITKKKIVESRTWHTVELYYEAASKVVLYVDGEKAAEGTTALDKAVGAVGVLASTNGNDNYYFDDMIVRTGDETSFLRETGVYLLPVVGDGPICDWTPSYLSYAGTGSYYLPGLPWHGNSRYGLAFRSPSSADVQLGDSWTIEAWFKLASELDATSLYMIMAKWEDSPISAKSWRLFIGGSEVHGGALTFEYVLTGGTSSLTLSSSVVDFDTTRWYHVAVSRSGTTLMIFLDGILVGSQDIGESLNVSTARVMVGAHTRPQSTLTEHPFLGYLDEVRLTNGTARYDVDFQPSLDKLPRTASEDPHWSDTLVLLGFDGSTANEAPSKYVTSSMDSSYEGLRTSEEHSPGPGTRHLTQSDRLTTTYVENRAAPATADVTVNQGATVGGTWGDITLTSPDGSYTRTYTFVTSSPAKNQVLIGSTLRDTLANCARAVNRGPGGGVLYGSGTALNARFMARLIEGTTPSLRFETRARNAAANTARVVVTGNVLSTTDAGVFTGGTEQPLTTQFVLGDLPAEVTKVHGVFPMAELSKGGTAFVKARLNMVVSGKTLTSDAFQLSTNAAWHHTVYSAHTDGVEFQPTEISGSVISVVQDPIETA